ncbi:putative methyl-accepting chemotaxis protein YoaH [compost metagenome]
MKLRIGAKLLLGFGAVLVLMGVVGLFSLAKLGALNGLMEDMYKKEVVGVSVIKEANLNLIYRGRAEKNAILYTEPAEVEQHLANMQKSYAKVQDYLTQYEGLVRLEDSKRRIAGIRDDLRELAPYQDQLAAFARQNEKARALEVARKARVIADRIDQEMTELANQKEAIAKDASETGHQGYEQARVLVLSLLLAAIALGVGIALYLARGISQGLRTVATAAEGIAKGELDQVVEVKSQDELGDMAQSFRQMLAYLKEVAGVAEAMSQGDLARDVTPKSERDQFGNAIAHMIASLRQVVGQVRAAADSVGAGAEQVGSSSAELSKTTSVQASSAEETSAAMEEMAANLQSVDASVQTLGNKVGLIRSQSDELAAAVTQTSSSVAEMAASIQQVAGNVAHASQVSEQAAQAANVGEAAVVKTIAGMQAISETMGGILSTIQVLDQRSGEIGAIIEVIDDIAEQTNLLALNAAIEAARAGDAGRGFAVVADEVRKLAERSAKATGEIGALIKGIQAETAQAVGVTQQGSAKVAEGAQLANHTGDALARIKEASEQVTILLSEVSAATSEQARASQQIVAAAEQMAGVNHQVTGAVGEMDQLTKTVSYATSEQRQGAGQVVIAVDSLSKSSQAAAIATEQVARAADDLNQQAQSLQEAVAFFKLNEQEQRLERRIGALALPGARR